MEQLTQKQNKQLLTLTRREFLMLMFIIVPAQAKVQLAKQIVYLVKLVLPLLVLFGSMLKLTLPVDVAGEVLLHLVHFCNNS